MANSKWYNWLLNPIRTLVNTINGDVSPTKWYESIPLIGDTISAFDNDYQSERLRHDIEAQASKAGMSLEEFLALNPKYKKMYDNPHDHIGIKGDITRAKDAVTEGAQSLFGLDLSELMPALINKLLGTTDVAENQKNREFQSEQAEISRQWQEEQAKTAREWDSIGAQMERAASVGVNPISIAMQNGGINASAGTSIPSAPSTPSGSSAVTSNSPLDIASTVFSGIGTLAENRLKQSQSDDIVMMRKYNIAEKIANTNHLQQLCTNVGLSNVAQRIQNQWLDVMNQATYDGMLLQNGVSRETIYRERSVTQLNLQQINSIRQDMQLNLERFNALLPLEVQLTQSEIDLKNASVQQVYEEICLRHLQTIEQESRNRQASADADIAQTEANKAKATYEDAISAFHNDMVRGAAEAGLSLGDYMYYGAHNMSIFDIPSAGVHRAKKLKLNKRNASIVNPNIQGLD